MHTRRLFLTGLGVAALGLASCTRGDGRKATVPVAGKVLVNGKPAEHATVVFHPVGGAGPDAVRPRGKVGPDGAFALTTYDGGDGAPAGEYRVTVELWLAGRPDEGPSNRLPAKYADPATSGLTATVGAGPTDLKPFELKR
jgi:hypothetical protein